MPLSASVSRMLQHSPRHNTIALQVQEPTLRVFIKRAGDLLRGIGFFSRCLLAWPPSTQGSRVFTEPPLEWPHLDAFNQRITEILDRPVSISAGGGLLPELLTFTPEAKEAWVAFYDRVEGELALGGRYYDVRDVATKAAENAARLSALFHVFEAVPGAAVSADFLNAACQIVEWHLNESRRFFGDMALPSGLGDAVLLDSWLINYCNRNGWTVCPLRSFSIMALGGFGKRAWSRPQFWNSKNLGVPDASRKEPANSSP
jgi:putative DNA primase/helicase